MFANKRGSGFAELMIALTILNIALLALIPTFIYSSKATLRNNFKTNAYNLGIRQLERIKSLDYEQVGTTSGNPSGAITYQETMQREGVSYAVKTRITWKDDTADGTYPTDTDPRDYKQVQVTVNLPTIVSLPPQAFTTDITRQSQEQIATGGNIEVGIVDIDGNPLEDFLATITSGPSEDQEVYTDENGKATFTMLDESVEEGDYALGVSKDGYVVDPTLKAQTTTVRQGETRILQFVASKPGKINIILEDQDNGQQIQSTTKISMIYPGASASEYSTETNSLLIEDLFPGIYEIRAENEGYELATEKDVMIEVGRTTNITLKMKRKRQGNLHLTVTDETTHNAISSANVLITGIDVPLTVQDITNVQGILEKQLGQQSFRLQISKQDYQTNTSTFNITHTGNTFVTVALRRNAPSGGTIRVIATDRNSNPVQDVLIWVDGPGGYRVRLRTDANGEAVFTGLIYGWYNVYRWTWGWRLVGQPLVRNGEEKIYRVRY